MEKTLLCGVSNVLLLSPTKKANESGHRIKDIKDNEREGIVLKPKKKLKSNVQLILCCSMKTVIILISYLKKISSLTIEDKFLFSSFPQQAAKTFTQHGRRI